MHLACNFQIGPNRSAFLKCESIPSSSLQAILSCQIQQDPVSVGSSLWFLCCWQWHNANFQLLTSNSQQKWRKLQPVLFLVGPCCQSQCTQRGFVTRCFPLQWHQGMGSQAACKELTGYLLSMCWCCTVWLGSDFPPLQLTCSLHSNCFSRLRQ